MPLNMLPLEKMPRKQIMQATKKHKHRADAEYQRKRRAALRSNACPVCFGLRDVVPGTSKCEVCGPDAWKCLDCNRRRRPDGKSNRSRCPKCLVKFREAKNAEFAIARLTSIANGKCSHYYLSKAHPETAYYCKNDRAPDYKYCYTHLYLAEEHNAKARAKKMPCEGITKDYLQCKRAGKYTVADKLYCYRHSQRKELVKT